MMDDCEAALRLAADHALELVDGANERPVGATATTDQPRPRLARPLPEDPCDAEAVIAGLVADAGGGLLGNTGGRFFAWISAPGSSLRRRSTSAS